MHRLADGKNGGFSLARAGERIETGKPTDTSLRTASFSLARAGERIETEMVSELLYGESTFLPCSRRGAD